MTFHRLRRYHPGDFTDVGFVAARLAPDIAVPHLPGDPTRKGEGMPGFFVFSGRKLRDARERSGLSRDHFAIAVGVTYPAVALWETGCAAR